MSGVLETMLARLAAVEAAVEALNRGSGSTAPANPLAALGGLGAAPAPAPVPANVGADEIVALITPHLDNEAMKTAFGTEMRAMGINSLPETQPAQYAELYGRFQRIIAGGAAPAASASII